MLLTFVIIQFLLSGVMSDCPTDCQCFNDMINCHQIPQLNSSSYRTFKLENSNPTLDVKKLSSLSEVQVMDLNGLKIEKIDNDNEEVILPNLTTLNLSFNKITHIEETTFTWCPHLINLDLSNNNIKTIERLTLNSIESLNLSHNSLYSVDSFTNLPPSLITLDINNNQLDEVPQLNQLTRLRDLNLCGNDYESWSGNEIKNCVELQSLCLGDLMVNGVSENAIAQFAQLTHLHLINKNKVHSTIFQEISSLISLQSLRIDLAEIVDLDFLNHLSKLERLELIDVKVPIALKSRTDHLKNIKYLDLSRSENLSKALLENHESFESLTTLIINGNNVSTIPFSSLPRLAHLDLSENPLLCNENLINFVALQNVTILHPKQTKCNLPPEFSGFNLKDVIIEKNNSLLKDHINSINFGQASNNETEESKLGLFLNRMGIERNHLFYICVGLIVLLIACTAIILILVPSKCKKYGGETHTGWRGRFGEGDSLCNDDAFFPKADNEYIFDNFSVSDTLARNVNPVSLTNQSTQ